MQPLLQKVKTYLYATALGGLRGARKALPWRNSPNVMPAEKVQEATSDPSPNRLTIFQQYAKYSVVK
jgi:hypothetical protein